MTYQRYVRFGRIPPGKAKYENEYGCEVYPRTRTVDCGVWGAPVGRAVLLLASLARCVSYQLQGGSAWCMHLGTQRAFS